MTTHIRHAEPPNPNGCRRCGRDQRSHSIEWAASVGLHNWIEPTQAQRLARMKARRKLVH